MRSDGLDDLRRQVVEMSETDIANMTPTEIIDVIFEIATDDEFTTTSPKLHRRVPGERASLLPPSKRRASRRFPLDPSMEFRSKERQH